MELDSLVDIAAWAAHHCQEAILKSASPAAFSRLETSALQAEILQWQPLDEAGTLAQISALGGTIQPDSDLFKRIQFFELHSKVRLSRWLLRWEPRRNVLRKRGDDVRREGSWAGCRATTSRDWRRSSTTSTTSYGSACLLACCAVVVLHLAERIL